MGKLLFALVKWRRQLGKRCSVRCPQRSSSGFETRSADDSGHYSSRSINSDDLASVWPVFGSTNESGAHRILEYIFPFRGVTLVAPQQMVVEPRLPERGKYLTSYLHRLLSHGDQNTIKFTLHSFNPLAQRPSAPNSKGDKQMNVIGHDHISSYADAKVSCPATISDERVMYIRVREQARTRVSVECYKIYRGIDPLKNQVQSWRLVFEHTLHTRFSNAQYPPLTSSDLLERALSSAHWIFTPRTPLRTADTTADSAGDSGRYSAASTSAREIR
jgi:hypothetical protein